jgi:transposase
MLQAILRAALAEIERLQLQIAGLQRHRFGRRSERLDEATLEQGIEDLEQSVADRMAGLEAAMPPVPAAKAAPDPPQSKPPKRNRGALPAHLVRVGCRRTCAARAPSRTPTAACRSLSR